MLQRLKRLGAGLLLCALLSGLAAAPASAAGFQDVPAGHWAAESIQRCADLGFIQGESATRFGLGEPMTRAAFAVALCRFFGWETETVTASTFSDVPADAWYAGAVEAAYTHGAVTDQRADFRPEEALTREELAVMLVRALGYGTIAGLAQDLTLPFTDVTTNLGYLTMAYDLGLMGGTSDTAFSPDAEAPREQVAVILMRLYDRLYGQAPETVALVSAPAEGETLPDLAALGAAAIPAGRLIGVGGTALVSAAIPAETAAAMRDAAREADAQALLYVEGGPTALDAGTREAAEVLVQAVAAGDYDGLVLDIPELDRTDRRLLTALAEELDESLGDAELCLIVEAPAWQGKTYEGYDYAALAQSADRLVARIGSYEAAGEGFPTAPVNPLEEVYYALATLRDEAGAEKLTILLDTAPTVWDDSGRQHALPAEELAALLETGQRHYSSRYACAYVTGTGEDGQALAAWFLDRQAVAERILLPRSYGVDQLWLTDWGADVQALLEAPET